MNYNQAFEVMQAENIAENTWKVNGRNYSDIQKGDTLFAHVKDEDNIKELPFEIVEILAFGMSLQELSYGYASELIVRGSQGEMLINVSFLYTK